MRELHEIVVMVDLAHMLLSPAEMSSALRPYAICGGASPLKGGSNTTSFDVSVTSSIHDRTSLVSNIPERMAALGEAVVLSVRSSTKKSLAHISQNEMELAYPEA